MVAITSVFGNVVENDDPVVSKIIAEVYRLFKIPLFTAVLFEKDGKYSLSSMGPVRYSKLTSGERHLLGEYLRGRWAPFTEGEKLNV